MYFPDGPRRFRLRAERPKLEAADYLLQPASYAAIEGAILHAVERLQQERSPSSTARWGAAPRRRRLASGGASCANFCSASGGGAQEAAEKASAFGFSCMPETLCRCVWVQIQHWEGEPMEYGLLLYGFQNVLEELLAPMSRQTTVLSLGGDAYLILLDADESGGASRRALQQPRILSQLCEAGAAPRPHLPARAQRRPLPGAAGGITCACRRRTVTTSRVPAAFCRSKAARRRRMWSPISPSGRACSTRGCGKAVREEIHAYFDRLSRQGALNREVLSAFHEAF